MQTTPVPIIRHTRCRSYEVQNMIDSHYAMQLCERHFRRSDCNYVQVGDHLCWTLYQAETRIRQHFH